MTSPGKEGSSKTNAQEDSTEVDHSHSIGLQGSALGQQVSDSAEADQRNRKGTKISKSIASAGAAVASAASAAVTDGGQQAEVNPNWLEIRVGLITKVWEHPDSEKLWCEEIDLAEESGPRQIASGLRHFYGKEAMLDRKVLVAANLKVAKLGGFASAGMILCASNQEHTSVKFLEVPDIATSGDRVIFKGHPTEPMSASQMSKKKILDRLRPDLRTDAEGVVTYKGAKLIVQGTGEVCRAPLTDAYVS